MKSTMLLLIVALGALGRSSAASLRSEYNHFVALDAGERVKLYWSVDKTAKSVSFAIEASTTGWVGFGLSSGAGSMVGADIVIGWVKDGKAYLTDRYAEGKYLPAVDKHNDYKLISGSENNGVTLLKFSRKIDTCDPKDRVIKEGTTKVIFALNDEDPEGENQMKIHSFKGAKSILLLNTQGNAKPPDASWKHFDILQNNFSVPAQQTTYQCVVFKVPEFTTKSHVVRFDPVVQPGNEGVVHHFVVMACDKNFPEHLANSSENCLFEANMPAEVLKCRGIGTMVAAWGVGGGAFIYPDHVGWPIGVEYLGRHFVMEVHYNNPQKIQNIVDNSGVRFYYTEELRKYDAGVYTVGAAVNPWMMIPPKQNAWLTSSYCSNECNKEALMNSSLPEKGIKFFSAFLHTHLAGRATRTKHIRNGVELPEIARDDNYDFNFQDIQFLTKEVHFKPGDDLIHECVYNTMDRSGLSFGGESTKDEMCIDFMFYYPYIPEMKRVCSAVDIKATLQILDKYYPELSNKNFSGQHNPMQQSNKTWTIEMTKDYMDYMKASKGESSPWCGKKNLTTFRDWANPSNLIPKIKITTPLKPPKRDCNGEVPSSAIGVRGHAVALVLVLLAVFSV